METKTKQKYFENYWQEQDYQRVAARSHWRSCQIEQMIAGKYKSILDVGAGRGDLADYFRLKNFEIEAWEISQVEVNRLIEYGFNASVVDLENDKFAGSFEVITCCEVLQQIKRPEKVIRKLDAILAEDGRLILSVPNEFHLLRKLGVGKPAESHVTLFSLRRFKKIISDMELSIEQSCYQPLTAPRWGKIVNTIGVVLAKLLPSLFSLSIMFCLKRIDDN